MRHTLSGNDLCGAKTSNLRLPMRSIQLLRLNCQLVLPYYQEAKRESKWAMYAKPDPSAAFLGPHLLDCSTTQTPCMGCRPCEHQESSHWGRQHWGRAALHLHHSSGLWLHQEQPQRLPRPTARQQTLHIICLSLQQRRNRGGREQENNARSSLTSQRVQESCRATTTSSLS